MCYHEDEQLRGDHVIDAEVDFEEEQNLETHIANDSKGQSENTTSDHTTCKKRRFLTNEERTVIGDILLNSMKNGRVVSRVINMLASTYSVSRGVIERIAYQIKETGDACHRKTKNVGRPKLNINIEERLLEVPLRQRTTLRSLSFALKVSKTSLTRMLKANVIRRHSNTIKPFLTSKNMKVRLRFCLSMLEDDSLFIDPTFKSMHNIIHIDEKWFYMTKNKQNYYLGATEIEPHRTCKNKNFITKIMFLVALARPRFDNAGNETFSGKIGVFLLVTHEPTKRRSANRAADTLVTKPISSINKEVCRNFLCNMVKPAIKEKWPRDAIGERIFIQQDNATCHINDHDEKFRRVACESGFDIHLMSQPPNSPDLNVLDLGYFNAIQALQHKEAPTSMEELIDAMKKSFEKLTSYETNKIFLTLQATMVEIMKAGGSNKYKAPHYSRHLLQRASQFPCQLKCDISIVELVLAQLMDDCARR